MTSYYVFLINFSHNIYEKQLAKNSMTLVWPFNVIQCQYPTVNWKAIYDLLYVFHTNVDHTMHRYEKQHIETSLTFIWPLNVI